jgi:hypothetical protein
MQILGISEKIIVHWRLNKIGITDNFENKNHFIFHCDTFVNEPSTIVIINESSKAELLPNVMNAEFNIANFLTSQ